VQYFSKFEALFLLRLDGDLYLHSCPPWIAKESSNQRRTPTPEFSPYVKLPRLSIWASRLSYKGAAKTGKQINDFSPS
jgi:hypothetical protein